MASRKHHLAKSVLYRIYSTVVSILVAQLFLGNWAQSASIGIAVNSVKIFTYYAYERIWLHANNKLKRDDAAEGKLLQPQSWGSNFESTSTPEKI